MEKITPTEGQFKRNGSAMNTASPYSYQTDPREKTIEPQRKLVTHLSIVTLLLGIVTLSVMVLFIQYQWAVIASAGATLLSIIGLIWVQKEAFKSRAAAFGIHSVVVSILALLLLGAINFFTHKHPKKLDLTRNQLNSLSDQSIKTVKSLTGPVTATFYAAPGEQENAKRILKLYRDIDSEKFKTEFVNPFLEQQRAQSAGVRTPNTLVLQSATGQVAKITELTEEKITNSLIKITKTKNIQICATSGHGEFAFDKQTADSFGLISQTLGEQSYLSKVISVAQEGKIPSDCQVLIVAGVQSNFTSSEIKALGEYLKSGGGLVVSLGLGSKGREPSPELNTLLKQWGIQVQPGVVLDPRFNLQSAEFPGAATYDTNHPVTKANPGQTFHPVARPLQMAEKNPGMPEGLKVTALVKSGPLSFAETDLSGTGPSKFDEGKDLRGPLALVMASEGKADASAAKSTRIVVFGSSLFGTKQFTQVLSANLDFYLNAVAWAAEDDSSISIRPKDNGPGNFVMSLQTARLVMLVTVILVPLLFALTGCGIWFIRRRL